ncbi:hypothetical protein [Dactylosporangium sp. CA-139066]|uniref:hypothetical protein n=1 Tax=Dactylosporangium sp. CA-139066 TaxID=3239930 RepID=UPI003D8EBCC9
MRLGVDLGTSHTVAVVSRPDGRVDAPLFGSAMPWLHLIVALGLIAGIGGPSCLRSRAVHGTRRA